MESSLNRDEQKELMDLLGLDATCWGAMQLMRRAYHRKCLEYHPDKGGNEEKMKRMNVLYKKLMDAIETETPEQTWCWDSTEVRHSATSNSYYMKLWGSCNFGLISACPCLMCTLRKCHTIRAKHKKLVWLRCYCFECFREWFGLDNCMASYDTWREILSETPYQNLQLF
ncbi:small T antigen [Glis glis polyomavirus 1]|uniref:Small t antigen n=1 Tax=Glis glis polyomavirus 1 TaxID=2170404 RepID=A0A2S1CJN0_9POLY|nr:small T antigen [Glis glis polyomavirus 1]AWD33763.1 small T antigen [Glis glis polyomavirus 1]